MPLENVPFIRRDSDIMIHVSSKSDMSKLNKYLSKLKDGKRITTILNKYGKRGVALLSKATPVDSGKTAQKWSYEIVNDHGEYTVMFNNSNVNNGVNIAIILQYGHGTRNGAYVKGIDYINPAIKQTFTEMTNELTKEVGRL